MDNLIIRGYHMVKRRFAGSESSSLVKKKMDYNILDFGAVGDGKTLCTQAIQCAIDRCIEDGGGRVVVEKGVYLTGSLFLGQNVELHIEGSGRILGSGNCADYPETNKKHVTAENLPRFQNTCLIYAEECSNVSITGLGTIDGNVEKFIEKVPEGEKFWQPYRRIPGPTPPRMIFFAGCKNVKIEDISVVDAPAGWSFLIHDCDFVSFDKVKIVANLLYPNNDGIHINCSRNVTVSNCDISCGDDCIIARANSRSLRENKVCEKISVINCNLTSHASGIRIGWRGDGVIRNCTFSNLVMTDTATGIWLWLPPGKDNDFGREDTDIENLAFSNIVMDNVLKHPICVQLQEGEHVTIKQVKNLFFDNIRAYRCHTLPVFVGRKDNYLENVSLTNCVFESDVAHKYENEEHKFQSPIIRYVKNLTINNTVFSVNS